MSYTPPHTIPPYTIHKTHTPYCTHHTRHTHPHTQYHPTLYPYTTHADTHTPYWTRHTRHTHLPHVTHTPHIIPPYTIPIHHSHTHIHPTAHTTHVTHTSHTIPAHTIHRHHTHTPYCKHNTRHTHTPHDTHKPHIIPLDTIHIHHTHTHISYWTQHTCHTHSPPQHPPTPHTYTHTILHTPHTSHRHPPHTIHIHHTDTHTLYCPPHTHFTHSPPTPYTHRHTHVHHAQTHTHTRHGPFLHTAAAPPRAAWKPQSVLWLQWERNQVWWGGGWCSRERRPFQHNGVCNNKYFTLGIQLSRRSQCGPRFPFLHSRHSYFIRVLGWHTLYAPGPEGVTREPRGSRALLRVGPCSRGGLGRHGRGRQRAGRHECAELCGVAGGTWLGRWAGPHLGRGCREPGQHCDFSNSGPSFWGDHQQAPHPCSTAGPVTSPGTFLGDEQSNNTSVPSSTGQCGAIQSSGGE